MLPGPGEGQQGSPCTSGRPGPLASKPRGTHHDSRRRSSDSALAPPPKGETRSPASGHVKKAAHRAGALSHPAPAPPPAPERAATPALAVIRPGGSAQPLTRPRGGGGKEELFLGFSRQQAEVKERSLRPFPEMTLLDL
jgi:hypothetical protein